MDGIKICICVINGGVNNSFAKEKTILKISRLRLNEIELGRMKLLIMN